MHALYRGGDPMRWSRRWQILGLVLTAFLIGHGALMAVAGAAPALVAEAGRHAKGPHAGELVPGAALGSEPTPAHPSNCSAAVEAAPSMGNPLRALDLLTPHAIPGSELVPVSARADAGWAEPLWPPGTRRALLQIYRV